MNKIKIKKSEREITNVEMDFIALTYANHGKIPDEYGQDATEWWNERVARLSEEQMSLYKYKFVECMSLRQIGERLGVSYGTINNRLQKMYAVLKKEK